MDKETRAKNQAMNAKQQEKEAVMETKKQDAIESKEKKKHAKKTNKTWEAFGKSKGCFIINDPKFLL